jgi:hypothetical protein
MKRLFYLSLFLLVTGTGLRAEDDAAAQAMFEKLMTAQSAKDYETFVADGTTQLQAALSKTQFEASSDILAPKFAKEHEIQFLGELNQRGYEVYLYRIRFQDGSDDIQGTLSLKEGKVAGILFR